MDGSTPQTENLPAALPCMQPASGEKLGDVAVMTPADVAEVVARARKASVAWRATSFEQRREVLRGLLALFVRKHREICELAAMDSGKTMVDAAMGEMFPVCEKLRYTIAHGEEVLQPERRSPGFLLHKTATLVYEPLGVVGVIAPWNFPFHNLMCPMIPALFAGNAVVTKVSELASWSSLHYIEMVRSVLREHGHNPDIVQVATGYGATGAALVRADVDKIFFTGSPQNGRAVMQEAAWQLKDAVLELGGKDPLIVCDDADLKRALDAAMLGVFTACGQMCVGAERIYVFDAVYDAFVAGAKDRIAALRQGPPLAGNVVDMGATTMPRQLEIIQELVDDAVAKGATLLAGGQRANLAKGTYYQPTLLANVDHSMRITQEEVFGPVMVVMRVQDEQDAIGKANDCPYGLGASVFTRDLKRGRRMAERIKAGMCVINDYGIAYMMQSLPFGGTKISGIGRINGPEGLRACCNAKAIVNDRLPFGKSVAIHPVRAATYGLVEGAVRTIYGQSLRERAQGAWQIGRQLMDLARGRN